MALCTRSNHTCVGVFHWQSIFIAPWIDGETFSVLQLDSWSIIFNIAGEHTAFDRLPPSKLSWSHPKDLELFYVLWSRFSRVQLFVTLWTIARQAPLLIGFSRQEYWSGFLLLFLLQGIFPNQGSNSCLLCLLYWRAGSLPVSATWKLL